MVKLIHIVWLFPEDRNNDTSHSQNSNIPHYLSTFCNKVRASRKAKSLYQNRCNKVNAREPFTQRVLLAPFTVGGYHPPAPWGGCCCPHTTKEETRPERTHSAQKVNSKVRIQSPFFIKFSKQGTEERWRASKLTIREKTKMREKRKVTAIMNAHPVK